MGGDGSLGEGGVCERVGGGGGVCRGDVDDGYFCMKGCRYGLYIYIVKPIFHQNAKYLASGIFASPNARNSTSASPNARISTCWYLLR